MNKKKITRLDIGCGFPHQRYKGCYGIDVNKKCKPDLVHNCDNGIPFGNNSIEFINSDNSLEHFKKPYFVLMEFYRVLNRNGRMRLVVPNCQFFPLILINLFYDLNKFWHRYMNLSFKKERGIHYTLFTKHLIQMLVKDVGFKIEKTEGWIYSKDIIIYARKK